jgi:hypothetical protein
MLCNSRFGIAEQLVSFDLMTALDFHTHRSNRYVGSAIILSGIFAGPPWSFNAAQIGYLGVGPFVGGLIGSLVCGFTGDYVIKFMTKRNKGI